MFGSCGKEPAEKTAGISGKQMMGKTGGQDA